MAKRKRRAEARQMALGESAQQVPAWTTLPEACRREVIELLAKLLRSEALATEEADDE
jgi:hypothetical protein